MKKYIFFLFLLLNSNFYSLSDLNKSLKININSNYKPIDYFQNHELIGSGFNFSFLSGIKLNAVTLSLEIDNDYSTLNGINANVNTNGAINIFRFAFSSFYNIRNKVELKSGLGGIWFQSPFQEKGSGWINNRYFGITILFNTKFFLPTKFFDFQLINKYDMLFITDENNSFEKLNHIYYGAVQFLFNPYIRWLHFYIEIGGNYIYYKNIYEDFNTAKVVSSIGISLDLNIPLNKNFSYKKAEEKPVKKTKEKKLEKKIVKKKEEKIEVKEKEKSEVITEEKKEEIIEKKTKEKPEDKEKEKKEVKTKEKAKKITEKKIVEKKPQYTGVYKNLYNSKINDKIVFNDIIFEEKKEGLSADSYKVLDTIAQILNETKRKINITAYSELIGNPLLEIELASKRGEVIKNYLISKNVDPEQMKVKYVGTIYNKNIKNDMPKIIFEIIE
ncbi:MAG: OmpA family protein [Spirochaetes bacterium]|nr:OmpA family protein [Spirochaetota bacterium]